MADPRKSQKSETATADRDLAALLRASLDEQGQESPTGKAGTSPSEEDELSRLLREQLERLGGGSYDAEPKTSEYAGAFDGLDEFEADEEPVEEIIEEPVEEIIEEPDEEIIEEPDEEIIEEPVEEIIEEPVEEIIEEPAEEIIEEPDEEIIEEPIEEIIEEPIEEIIEEPVEEIIEEPVEEIIEEPDEDIYSPAAVAYGMPLHEFMASMTAETAETAETADEGDPEDDYDLNGRTMEDTLADTLWSDLDQDTQRALRGIEDDDCDVRNDDNTEVPLASLTDEITVDDLPPDVPVSDYKKENAKVLEVRDPAPATWHDPLQLTLDTIRVAPKNLPKSGADVRSSPVGGGGTSPHATDAVPKEEELHGYAVIRDDESKDRDTALYFHLGYEKEVEQMEDVAFVQRVSDQCNKEEYIKRDKSGLRNTPPVIYDGEEYTSSAQTCEEERAYAGAQILCKVRLWLTLAFALVGVAFDILPDFAGMLGPGLEAFVGSYYYPMLGFAWLMIACLPAISHLWRGLRSLWELKPVMYAIPATALLLSLTHTAVAFFLAGKGIRLYIGASLLLLLMACLCDCFKIAAERMSFRVASSGKSKYVVTAETNPALKDADEETYARSFRVRRVERLSDYFMQVTRYDRKERYVGRCIAGAFLGALTVAGIVIVTGKGAWLAGLSAFSGTYLVALPGTYLVMLTLPLLFVNRRIGSHGCAVLTPEATDAYAPGKRPEPEAMHLYFNAGDVLKASHIKAVTMAGDDSANDYRRLSNRLFSLLNFPLCDEAFPVREETLKGIHLEIAESDETCLRLYMVDPAEELACEVLMGSYEALRSRGIKLPKGSMERVYKRTEDSRVLYMAFDRKFRLAYSVKYRPRRSFAQAVKSLTPLGYVLSVISYDPLITKDLLSPLTTGEQPRIDLIRPDTVTEERDSRSCTIVATGRAVDVAYPLTACRHLKTLSRRAKMLAWLSALLAVAGLGVCLGFGILSHIGTLLIWAWQLGWAGIAWLCVRIALRHSRLSMTEKD